MGPNFKRFSTFVSTFVSMMLVASIAFAQEKEKEAPLWTTAKSVLKPVWHYVGPVLTPDRSLWWLWAITFSLTLVWLTKGSKEMRATTNNAGGFIVCGLLALFPLLLFYSPFIGLVLLLFNKIIALINLGMNPTLGGIWDMFWDLFFLIPLFFVLWILSKIPGVEKVLGWVLNPVKNAAKKIWDYRATIEAKPRWYWQIVGATLIALAITGKFSTQLTHTKGLVPGLIPVVSGAVGLFFLIFRILPGRQLVGMTLGECKVRKSDGAIVCPGSGQKILKKNGKKIPDPDRPGKFKTETVRCKGHILPHEAECPNPHCKQQNPLYILKCRKCGFAGEQGKGFKRDHWRKAQECPKCGHLHPPTKISRSFRNVKAPEKAQAQPEATHQAPTEKVCSSCGKIFPSKARACPYCGTPRTPPGSPATPPVGPTPAPGLPPVGLSAVALPTATATLTLSVSASPPAPPPPPAPTPPAPASIPPAASKQYPRRKGHRSLSEKWR